MLKAFAMMISSAFCTCNKNNNNNTHTRKKLALKVLHICFALPLYTPPPTTTILLYVYNKRNKAEMLSSVMINERKL